MIEKKELRSGIQSIFEIYAAPQHPVFMDNPYTTQSYLSTLLCKVTFAR